MELNGEDQPADSGDTPNATIATGPFTVWQMTTVVLKSN